MRCTLLVVVSALLLAHPAFGQIEMTTASGGNVGIGISPDAKARLYVYNDDSASPATYGLWTEVAAGNSRFGLLGETSGTATSNATGVYGSGSGAPTNRGVYSFARASSGETAYGIYGSAAGAGTLYAGYFSGDVYVTGTVTENSDAIFKVNVRALEVEQDSQGRSVLERFGLLQPVAYGYSEDAQYAHMNLPEGDQFGFVSQDVETVFPELVSEGIHPPELIAGEDGEMIEVGETITYKGLNYIHLVPILVHVVQKQQAEIDALRVLVEELMEGGG